MSDYREVEPIDRIEAERAFISGRPDLICDALVRVTFHDPDWQWVQRWCVHFLGFDSDEVRGLAATCLGHVARIHRTLDRELVVPMLERLTADPAIGGRAGDALDDIRQFLGQ